MSVEIYDAYTGQTMVCFGVSSERYFCRYWEQAITELGITTLGNGVWLYLDDLEEILSDFRRVREWAGRRLAPGDARYLISHIDRILELLPRRWRDSRLPRLWMG